MTSRHQPQEQMSSLRAVAHPLRLRMLSLLTGAELSAAEIARELGVSHANASYHLRFLAAAGQVVEAGEEKIRGGLAKRYRHPWDDPAADARGSREDGARYVRAVADELVRRFSTRRPGGRHTVTDAEMWVPTEVWERVVAMLEEASTTVHAEARPPRADGTVHVNLTVAAFEMTDDQERADEGA